MLSYHVYTLNYFFTLLLKQSLSYLFILKHLHKLLIYSQAYTSKEQQSVYNFILLVQM